MGLSRLRAENAWLRLECENSKKPPSRLGLYVQKQAALYCNGAWTVAAGFLEAFVPVKKPGPVKAEDSAVFVHLVTPFRKI
jgi:hypothetical protein